MPTLQDGYVKFGPNLKLDLSMFLVEDIFLASADQVLLRVRIEIEKNSNSFDKIADLKILTKGDSPAFMNTHI